MTPPRRRRFELAPGQSPGALLAAAGEPDAIAEGRAFLDGRRLTDPEERSASGGWVEVFAERSTDEPVAILAEHAGLVAAYKPAAIATEPDRQGSRTSLLHAVARELRLEPNELSAISRLDVGVSGVVLLCRAGAERPAWSQREYVAIASASPAPPDGTWESPIAVRGRSKPATTRYRTLEASGSGAAMLELEPVTGRTHQLRIHCARAGAPLFGDRAHGGPARLVRADGTVLSLDRIALHARRVRLPDGWQVESAPPERFVELWREVLEKPPK
jgi:23S rRNA-/tRNA-specific pseudouridylate synthase